MVEQWKWISGYEKCYKVSNLGRVMSFQNRYSGRIMKQQLQQRGYPVVSLNLKTKKKTHKVHRLVGVAFVKNPKKYPQINHKDCNKKNNRYDNLEWCTNKENAGHAIENGLFKFQIGTQVHTCKLTEKQVIEIFNSQESKESLAIRFNVTKENIWAIRSGKTWKQLKKV